MGKKALKKSVEQLQQLFDFLGEYGGQIETYDLHWPLNLEVKKVYDDKKEIFIEIFKNSNENHELDELRKSEIVEEVIL